jgi:hypothetical protein
MIESHIFRNFGYLKYRFEKEDLSPILLEIELMKEKGGLDHRKYLAGHIEKEFRLVSSKDYLESLILPFSAAYENKFNYTESISLKYMKDRPLVLSEAWVNFQQKGEFNPMHKHSGLYSFVIWIDIPYDIEEEKKHPKSSGSNCNYPGHFMFIFSNVLGGLFQEPLPVDRSWNYTMVLFPAVMNHEVLPFYGSDGYRISLAGNIGLA